MMGGDVAKMAAEEIDRRALLGRVAAVAIAGSAAASLGASAAAASTRGLRTFEGAYAIHGGEIVHGYFAAPAAAGELPVMVIVPAAARIDPAARAAANRQAAAGYLVVVPDLAATYGSMTAREGQIAHLRAAIPNLKRLSRGNGRISVTAA